MAAPAQKAPESAAKIAPELVGLPIGEARAIVRKRLGIELDFKILERPDRIQGTIVAQKPPAGGEVDEEKGLLVEIAGDSWMRFLPGIYQDSDEDNGDFLKKFLFIQQHIDHQTAEKLENQHRFFDPRQTPQQFLPWLASWMALSLQEGWKEERRREILCRAAELFRLRGTAAGLQLALKLFAETDAKVIENEWPYPGFIIGQKATITIESVLAPRVPVSQCFVVDLGDDRDKVPREKLRSIHAVIEAEKPAHAHYALRFPKAEEKFEPVPFLHMGVTGRIGVDTRIGGNLDRPATVDEFFGKTA
jgi:phage tail-like protein